MNCAQVWNGVQDATLFCLPTPQQRAAYIDCASQRMCARLEAVKGVSCTYADKALFGIIAAVAFDAHVAESGCIPPIVGNPGSRVPGPELPPQPPNPGQRYNTSSNCSVALAEMENAVDAFLSDATAFVGSIAGGGFGGGGKSLAIAQSVLAKHAWILPLVASTSTQCGGGNLCKKLSGLSLAMASVTEWALGIIANPSAPPEAVAMALDGLDSAYLIDVFANKIESAASCG